MCTEVEVDGRMKAVFATLAAAQKRARDLKAEFPMLQIKVYDAEKKTRTRYRSRSLRRDNRHTPPLRNQRWLDCDPSPLKMAGPWFGQRGTSYSISFFMPGPLLLRLRVARHGTRLPTSPAPRRGRCFECDGLDPLKTDKVMGWLKGELQSPK
jgi:hypothetical protein